MKKYLIPIMAVALVVSLVIAGCAAPAPAPAPAPTPAPAPEDPLQAEYQRMVIDAGLAIPSLPRNPYAGLAIKPDGTPFVIAGTPFYISGDFCYNAHKLIGSFIERSGARFIGFDPDCDPQRQIAFIEDLITLEEPDALIIECTDEQMLAPVLDRALDAGTACFDWDVIADTASTISSVYHDFDGPTGSCVAGQYFVDYAESTGEHLYIFEVWGIRSLQSHVDRHNGFHSAVDGHPLITVLESADSLCAEDVCATLVMDAYTVEPDLNALFAMAGGMAGTINGLESIGRLLPIDHPDHILTCMNDVDTRIVEAMYDGQLDAFATHGCYDLVDVVVKLALTYTVLGQTVPDDVIVPMVLVTSDTIDTEMLFGVTAVYSRMPAERWDLWPVCDTTEIGIPTPTKELRMQLKGY